MAIHQEFHPVFALWPPVLSLATPSLYAYSLPGLPFSSPRNQSRELLGSRCLWRPACANSEEGSGTAQASGESSAVPIWEHRGACPASSLASFFPRLHFCLPPAHVADLPNSGSPGHLSPEAACKTVSQCDPNTAPKASSTRLGGRGRGHRAGPILR